MKKHSSGSKAAPPPIDPHVAYQRAHYRLLRNVATWLIAQPPGGVVVHASQANGDLIEKAATCAQMIADAREWWDIACAVWFESGDQHNGHGDCLCPLCTERQSPLLHFQEEST